MNIAVLDYTTGRCDFIINAPDMDTTEEIEEWLSKSYRLDDIYYMCDAELQIVKAK